MENIVINFTNASDLRVALVEMTEFALFMAKEFSVYNGRVDYIYEILKRNNIPFKEERNGHQSF